MTRRQRLAAGLAALAAAAVGGFAVLARNAEAFFEQSVGIEHLDAIGFARRWIDGPGGRRISYFESGDPAAGRVVYVHGTPGDANNWSAYVKDPVDGMQSISYDRPGFGRTEPAAALPSLADQARALGVFLDTDGPPAVLVGHSLGGPIIVAAALDRPDRVAGLVIAAGSLDPDLERWAWFNVAADLAPVRLLLPPSWRHANDEIRPLKDELTALGTRLPDLAVPTIIVHARDDTLVPFANVAYMQRRMPAAAIVDVVALDKADHFVIWNAADAVRDAVRRLARD